MVHFREELDELQARLLEMGGLVESAIHQSVTALVQRDEEAAKEVLWKEALINQKDIEIDEFATRLLALYQPMARDMRFLTAVIKINGDLERMGDLAVNITERALSLMRDTPVKPLIDIPKMASLAETMVRKSLDALVKRDEALARSVLMSDDEVDRLRDAVYKELVSFMQEQSTTIPRASRPDVHRAQPRAGRRSRHQHRRGCALLDQGHRRAPPRRSARASDTEPALKTHLRNRGPSFAGIHPIFISLSFFGSLRSLDSTFGQFFL